MQILYRFKEETYTKCKLKNKIKNKKSFQLMVTPSGVSNLWVFVVVNYFILYTRVEEFLGLWILPIRQLRPIGFPRSAWVGCCSRTQLSRGPCRAAVAKTSEQMPEWWWETPFQRYRAAPCHLRQLFSAVGAIPLFLSLFPCPFLASFSCPFLLFSSLLFLWQGPTTSLSSHSSPLSLPSFFFCFYFPLIYSLPDISFSSLCAH